jgi:hypothetical protein
LGALHAEVDLADRPRLTVRTAVASAGALRFGRVIVEPATRSHRGGQSISVDRDRLMTSEPRKQTMEQMKTARANPVVSLGLGFCMSVAPLAGCDSSTSVKEIPEASRKALIQRKVDVKPGQSKSSRSNGSVTKGRASGR